MEIGELYKINLDYAFIKRRKIAGERPSDGFSKLLETSLGFSENERVSSVPSGGTSIGVLLDLRLLNERVMSVLVATLLTAEFGEVYITSNFLENQCLST